VADRLGADPDQVEIVTGDTDRVPQGTGTFGSRTMMAAGAAIVATIERLAEELKPAAAEALEAAVADIEFAAGVFAVAGTDRRISFKDVTDSIGEIRDVEVLVSTEGATFPNGCHICEVEIEPETGAVAVLGYVVVDDIGTVINPLLVEGQIHGGIAQGFGQALLEQAIYDPESGQLLTASFSDYTMPRAADLPLIEVESCPAPTKANRLGVKGVGEAGTVGALPAVISAVCDALSPLGIRHIDMPATPERIWRAIREAFPEME
ncbi:MAG TPA: molybdopterin cofactor-binding domain-containing protein, partial [Propylenella sp.]|nr:molybdopterin cofactor-binding domain-containing protein [Propylenella sp.]